MEPTQAVRLVLEEEIERQQRKAAEVCRSAGVHKNAIYKLRSGTLTVPTLWALAGALKVPVSEIAYRAERKGDQ